jgi:hypothetical protein
VLFRSLCSPNCSLVSIPNLITLVWFISGFKVLRPCPKYTTAHTHQPFPPHPPPLFCQQIWRSVTLTRFRTRRIQKLLRFLVYCYINLLQGRKLMSPSLHSMWRDTSRIMFPVTKQILFLLIVTCGIGLIFPG